MSLISILVTSVLCFAGLPWQQFAYYTNINVKKTHRCQVYNF